MAKTPAAPKAQPKEIPVYVLDDTATGLKDFMGNDVGNVEKFHIYMTLDDNTEVSTDGSTKLYTPPDGIFDPDRLGEIVKGYGAVVQPTGMGMPTVSNVTATGAKVSWAAPTGGSAVDNYIVSVSQGGTNITGSPFTMSGSTLTKTLSGLTADTEYKVVVTAKNSAGQTDSPELAFTTSAAAKQTPPTGGTGTGTGTPAASN